MSLTIIRPGGGGGGAGGDWTFITETVLAAPAATVTLAAIPGTYRHLILLAQLRTDLGAGGWDRVWWRANADAGANYDYGYKYSTIGGGWVSTGAVAQTQAESLVGEAAPAAAGVFAPNFCVFEGYALVDREKSTTQHAIIVQDYSAGDLMEWQTVGHWRNFAAITSLTFGPLLGANFATGSIFTLYGVT